MRYYVHQNKNNLMEDTAMKTNNAVVKGTFWSAAAFYVIIAFEFLYMASPFAIYFYSVYAPALNFFNDNAALAWLNSFFLPHVVRSTSSAFINVLTTAGAVLAITGFLAFCIGACQVYYSKLTKKGVVTGGIYNIVRHPQYTSFIICSLGLLIMWPRFIGAIMFVTMIFAYYLLAKAEERECAAKFGQSYIDYRNKTNMFLPLRIAPFSKLRLPKSKTKKALALLAIYCIALLVALGMASGLQSMSINSLHSTSTNNSVNISISEMSEEKINHIMHIINTDDRVVSILAEHNDNAMYINYILPTTWFAPEIPMNGVERGVGHASPRNYDPNHFKVIITRVNLRNNDVSPTLNLLTNVHTLEAVIEVWVDLSEQRVAQILDIPEGMYEGIPVAIF